MFLVTLSLAVLLLSIATANLATAQESPVVQTTTGPVRGRLISITPVIQVYEFIGIPFAEPPTGERRFARPVPKEAWSSVLNANQQPKGCIQDTDQAGFAAAGVDESMGWSMDASEDCLYLNIWVPKNTLDSKSFATAPYTFIHGGGFTGGAISTPAYDMSVMAGYNDIVTASIQYRLGFLGFAYESSGQNAQGNMGMWDQVEALKWLCENFAAFGADCEKHTIGGESAGAISVALHLLSPQSRPYFRRGILQSGSAYIPGFLETPEAANLVSTGMGVAANNGSCAAATDKWQCLRDLPGETIVEAQQILTFTQGAKFAPVIDGEFLPRHPKEMLDSGEIAKYPTIVGFNEVEGSLMMLFSPYFQVLLAQAGGDAEALKRNMNFTEYDEMLKSIFGMFAPESHPLLLQLVKHHYWPVHYENGFSSGSPLFDAVAQAVGDYMITCPSHDWIKRAAAIDGMGEQIWAYQYSHMPQHPTFPKWLGATHAAEIPLVYGQPFAAYARQYNYSRSDELFSRILMTFWANFIKNGDPNVGETEVPGANTRLRTWPVLSGDDNTCQARFVDLSSTTQNARFGPRYICAIKARDCTLWNDHIPKLSAALPDKA